MPPKTKKKPPQQQDAAAAATAAAAPAPSPKQQAKARTIQAVLDHLYPDPPIPLDHTDNFTLLIAVILSAQTTDGKVNQVCGCVVVVWLCGWVWVYILLWIRTDQHTTHRSPRSSFGWRPHRRRSRRYLTTRSVQGEVPELCVGRFDFTIYIHTRARAYRCSPSSAPSAWPPGRARTSPGPPRWCVSNVMLSAVWIPKPTHCCLHRFSHTTSPPAL